MTKLSSTKLLQSGIRTFLAIHNAPISSGRLDYYRYSQFVKFTKLNRPVQLSNLPPSNAAAHEHIKRVYYQVQTWLGNCLEPQDWGWMLQNQLLEPTTTILPPAPDELLNTIFASAKMVAARAADAGNRGCTVLVLVGIVMDRLVLMPRHTNKISMKNARMIHKSWKVWKRMSLRVTMTTKMSFLDSQTTMMMTKKKRNEFVSKEYVFKKRFMHMYRHCNV